MTARQRIRDYCRTAREEAPGEPLPILKQKLAAKLRESEPELLIEWLEESLEEFLYDELRGIGRSNRSHARQVANRFEEYLGEYLLDSDDIVSADGTRKPFRDMNKTEVLFVARNQRNRSEDLLLDAVFHEAVAQRLGRKTVGGVFTEGQLSELYRITTGREAA